MKNLNVMFVLFIMFGTINIQAQCNSNKSHHAKKTSYQSNTSHQNLVDIAAGSEDFSTLVAAVTAADLVSTLKSDGPFTIFAPTNTAFSKLPAGTLEALLEPSAKSTLSSILTYHVIPANITADGLINSINAAGGSFVFKTVNGNKLTTKIMNGNPVLIDQKGNKSFITNTDIKGSNGVIHVIDTVIMP